MISSQKHQASPAFVVKRTFLEVANRSLSPDSLDDEKVKSGLRLRVSSDSALYELAGIKKIDSVTSLEFATLNQESHSEAEFVLTGLSDEETESVITSATDERNSASSSFLSQDTAKSSQKEEPRSPRAQLDILEKLTAENARLAMENSQLRQDCLDITAGAQDYIRQRAEESSFHCATPEMMSPTMSSDPNQSLEDLLTFSLPDTMHPEHTPQMGAFPMFGGTVQGSDGMPFQNYVWAPVVCGMPVVPVMGSMTQEGTSPFMVPQSTVVNHATPQNSVKAKPLPGKKGARAARAEQMFAKHASAASETVGKHMPRMQQVPSAQEANDASPDFDEQHEPPEGSSDCNCPMHLRTTVMLRNLPNNYTRSMLLDLINSEGFANLYDFVYLPVDFNSKASLGYAFVNFTVPKVAQRFRSLFNGFSNWILPSRKVCSVNWSGPHQGLEAHIERYRNSPVMHEAVPDMYKPALFTDGRRAPFPPPTKKLRAPRIRYFRGRGATDLPGSMFANPSERSERSFQPGLMRGHHA